MLLGRDRSHLEQNKPSRYRIVDIPTFYLPFAPSQRHEVPPCNAPASSESHRHGSEPDSNWDLNEHTPQIQQVPIRPHLFLDRYHRD